MFHKHRCLLGTLKKVAKARIIAVHLCFATLGQVFKNKTFLFISRADPAICPGTSECSICDDFQGSDFGLGDCDASCNMCPLCALFYVKPGCDYCKNGVDGCKRDCKNGKRICELCRNC